MSTATIARASTLGGLSQYGTDWAYVLIPVVAFAVLAVTLSRRVPRPPTGGAAVRFGRGASQVTGLPAWAAAPMVMMVALALPLAVIGFFWDVAWHIDIGRDEFLLSPPHVALLTALSAIGVAGVLSSVIATRTGADVAWRVGHWRVPASAAAMIVAGVAATIGWGIDELWHQAYGLDVTMWSPPHLTMISSAAFMPIAAWLLFAEAGPGSGDGLVRRHLPAFAAAAVLVGLSAWQLEFDLGVPQWQALYQPVLIASAGAFALTAARVAFGARGTALVVGHFILLRTLLWAVTTFVWGFSQPRFPLYVAAALAVELAFRVTDRPLVAPVLAGLGVATLGLGGEALWSQVAFHDPWTTTLLPGVWVAVPAAVGAAVLGAALGRVTSYRSVRLSRGTLGLGAIAVLVALAVPFPRNVPAGSVTITTAPAGEGLVDVTVTTDRTDLVSDADRWELMTWQGGGHALIALVEVSPGTYTATEPVPVHGRWKSYVWLASRDQLAAAPIRMPADPLIDAPAVPVVSERTQAWQAQTDLLLREAHAGPAWPGVVASTAVALSVTAIVGLLLAAAASIARRRSEREDGPRRFAPGTVDQVDVARPTVAGPVGHRSHDGSNA